MNRFDKYDQELIKSLVIESTSLTQVCEKLQISTGGYSTKNLREYLEENNIDYSHFKQKKVPQTKEQYEANPNLCKKCGKPLPWEKRRNEFCDRSCSASYNNKGVARNSLGINNVNSKTKLQDISNEDFIEIIKTSKTWTEILSSIGYSINSGVTVKENIKNRAKDLGIKLNIKENKKDWNKITKGELFSERKNWQSARSSIRKIAENNYKNSGKPYECIVCGYNKHIEIAHIKAVSDFNDDATIVEINDINNLVGLCPNHHWEFDNNLLDITSYLHCKEEK